MDKCLRPERFGTDANSPQASRKWQHWHRTFTSYLGSIDNVTEDQKLNILINHVDSTTYEYISEAENYASAIETLKKVFVRPSNEVFARHLLATSKQQSGETIDQYFQRLKRLSLDCKFADVTAATYREETIRDAFIAGISSNDIRQRLLESEKFELQAIFDKARSLDVAQKSAERITSAHTAQVSYNVAALKPEPEPGQFQNSDQDRRPDTSLATATADEKCYFCGRKRHSRRLCPAKDSVCFKCNKKGHFAAVCRAQIRNKSGNTGNPITAAIRGSTSSTIMCLSRTSADTESKVNIPVKVDGHLVNALVDTGSTISHMSEEVAKRLRLRLSKDDCRVGLAVNGFTFSSIGKCQASVELSEHKHHNVQFSVLKGLLTDVVLGQDFMQRHQSVSIHFGGAKSPLQLGALKPLKVISKPHLFEFMSADCHPIAAKSRRYSSADLAFIKNEVRKLLAENIIEPSNSPWRSQVVVTRNENHKKRMCIDYSQTVNKFTLLDGYPLPRMQDIVQKVSLYNVYSTLDLKSAYHQVELPEESRTYTAFEADGKLYQFRRLPFGLKNAVPCFQRIIDDIIEKHGCKGTYAYLDNITVCGKTQQEHDENLKQFLSTAEKCNLTFNDSKCIYSSSTIDLLGYRISKGTLKPDPERVQPLLELPAPANRKALRRVIGMFAYYAQWIPKYSDKIKPLVENEEFPMHEKALKSFEEMKEILADVTLDVIREDIPFTVETDASDIAVSATLNQNEKPVAFFSRTLRSNELHHSCVEKEATAIVEAIRKWSHLLLGRRFKLITDQKSVAYMYDNRRRSKVKNNKILRWRMELSAYDYDIIYRAGKYNAAPDTLSRAHCASMTKHALYDIHSALCHPGVTRLYHFVRTKNLPYSLDEVRRTVAECRVCAEIKPNFIKPPMARLIKATQPFERLSIDFKGPLPSVTKNHYILTIVDEYSRFPFAFPCSNMESKTVIECLSQLFAIFGLPSYVHSDCGKSFVSAEFVQYLNSKGVSTSNTSTYNPQGNGQCERYNAIIWSAVQLALKSKNMHTSQWQFALPDALHSIRSLLCTATNATPHERMFQFQRKSSAGMSTPTWISYPRPVLLKRHGRSSKYEPLVDEVQLIHATPNYAQVQYKDGREATVPLRDVAPVPDKDMLQVDGDTRQPVEGRNADETPNPVADVDPNGPETPDDNASTCDNNSTANGPADVNGASQELRRSTRQSRPPDRFHY